MKNSFICNKGCYILSYALLILITLLFINAPAQTPDTIRIFELSFKTPDKDWKVRINPNKSREVTLYKEKVSILTTVGSSVISVYKDSLSNEACTKSEKEIADSILHNEIKLLDKDFKNGKFEFSDTKIQKKNKFGKDFYTLSFQTKVISQSVFNGDNVLFLYFPKDFKERHVFYGFMVNDYVAESAVLTDNNTEIINPVLESFKIEGLK